MKPGVMLDLEIDWYKLFAVVFSRVQSSCGLRRFSLEVYRQSLVKWSMIVDQKTDW